MSDDFWKKVCTGENIHSGHPVSALRTRLINDRMTKGNMEKREKAALIIKSWNAFRKGKELKSLVFRSNESFPEIL